eukprot:gb/GEZN01010899.1/.p2 GENE.gb/GEZN01010899.1/~~gb/GEZN01010899.1/.p2  ORF type:complete len:126 (-),score=32.63 gb/GEZN01010899.1/:519-896(-)
MASYLADRVILYTGTPGQHCVAHAPQSLLAGMNSFLQGLGITFRRDPGNYRPRINKRGGQHDQAQKKSGVYFYTDMQDEEDEQEEEEVKEVPKNNETGRSKNKKGKAQQVKSETHGRNGKNKRQL